MANLDADKQELRSRALDAAISAMARNRALIFTLNIIAAAVLVTVYLERMSFDEKYRRGYLLGVHSVYQELISLEMPDTLASETDLLEDTGKIERWAFKLFNSKNVEKNKKWLQEVSNQLLRLYRIKNELSSVKLPDSPSFPIGLAIPRNDLVPIAGIIMVLLYAWLRFSFQQLARIVRTLRDSFVNNDPEDSTHEGKSNQAESMFSQIISLHYLFRTSEGGPAAWLVRALYFSPPVVMIIALLNDILSITVFLQASDSFSSFLLSISYLRMLIVAVLTVILCFIAYQIHHADRGVNKASYGPSMTDRVLSQ